jgi:hypothetical protein
MESLERLVQNPGTDEDSKDRIVVGDRNQDSENDNVDQSFEELAVVHGADAGNKAQYRRSGWIRTARRYVKGWNLTRWNLAGRNAGGPCGRKTGVAVLFTARRRAYTVRAEGLAAVLAIGLSIGSGMIYAMHEVLRSGIANTRVSIEPVSIRSGSFKPVWTSPGTAECVG